MMDKLYDHYSEVSLYYGVFGLIIKLMIFSGEAIYEYKNKIEGIMSGIKIYFTETNVFVIIFFQFLYIFVYSSINGVLIILIMYYLRPNHIIVSDEIFVIENTILLGRNPNKYYIIITFFVQIIALLFYFEILELNFWSLNKNTVKNIKLREIKERTAPSDISQIELPDQYYLRENEFNAIIDESGLIDNTEN